MAEGNVIPGEMKKKRRQNVACDSCKFRRIKCDLSELLVPDQAGSGSSDGTSVPLAQLVRDNPDVECTNCKNKGVKCTAEQILNPAKPNKGGKRIDEARKRFGGSGAEGSGEGTPVGQGGYEFREQAQVPMQNDSGLEAAPPSTLDHGLGDTGGMDGIEGMDWGAFMNLPGMEDLLAGMDTTVPTMDAQASNPPILDSTLDLSTFSFPTDQDSFGVSWDQSGSTTNMNPSLAPASGHAFSAMDPANPHLDFSNDNPVPLYEPSQATATVSSLPTPSSAEQGRAPSRTPDPSAMSDMSKSPYFHQSLVNALGQRDFEAHGIWSDLALGDRGNRTPPPAQAKQSDLGPRFRTGTSPGVVTLDGHTASSPGSSRAPSMPFSFKFDGGPTKFISYDATPKEVLASQAQVFTNKVLNPHATYRPHTNQAPLSMYFQPGQHLIPAGKDAHLAPARKRQRAEFSPSPDSEDPWRLWSDDGRDAHDLVRWGRREVVQQRLADRALGGELSRHLVMAYFHCVHPSFPALSPEGFYLEWERAGKVSERMTPAQEALCAVMEAWGARYSDSPVVLGLSPSRAGMAPKVIQADGTLAPGSQARAHWGKARLAVCNALADRARRLIDNNGLLRTPSVTGLQALLLYNQLLHLTDQRSRAAGQFMENQMVHASIVEQMKLLQLMWDATGDIPVEDGELPITVGQNRMKQRIFWTVLVSDAFNAAASGDLPKIADEELDSVAQWLSQVEAKLPLSTFKTLAFFMSCYHRITLAARALARKITHPGRRPGTIVVADFCQAVRDCWTQTKSISRDITVITAELLQSCEHSLLGFSPMNYITNLRMSCPFILLVLHQAIREQLDFRKNLRESYIFDESPKSNPSQSSGNSPPGPGSEHVALLEELHLQSVDVLLHSCRSQMEMYKTILPTGMVQTASIFLRVLIASAQFLAEVPTVEQGYPANTLGGYEWTWENKQKEVGTCVEALYQLGWAWADVQEVLDSVLLAMERMTPTEAQLAAYIVSQPSIDERIVVARLVDESNDELLFDRAMQFWPPQSIPAIIEHAMRDLRITDDSTPLSLDAPDAVPWDDLKRISGTRPGNAAPHEIAGSVTSPIGTGSNNSTDPSSRLHALLAAKGHAAHDMAQAADVPWTGTRKVSTNGDAPTTSDRNGTGVLEESRIGGFSEGMVYSASATQGWAMSGSGPPNGSAGSGRSGPTTPQTAPRLRPHGEPQAKKLHLDPDIAFGVVDLSTPQDGSSVGLRSGMASASTGTYFGQDTTRKHDLGPGWTAQPGQYPVAPADDSWNLNDLAGNEWLGFHTPSALGRGVGGVAATGAGATHDAGTLDEGGVDPRSAIDELMCNFEEVTRNGTGYHGPRP